jgi:hypothetical protein
MGRAGRIESADFADYTDFNRRYLFNVGVVIIGRVLYAVLLFAYILFVADFPTTFLPTAVVDSIWTVLYIILTLLSDEVRFRDLFLTKRGDN